MPLSHENDTEQESKRGEYVIGSRVLGKGATSIVKFAVNLRTKEPAAVKIVHLFLNAKKFHQELNALALINHPNIVKLLHYETRDDNGILFLEYLPFPSLFDHIQNFGRVSNEVGFKILSQIVDAFKLMHYLGFSHNDFKPENTSYNPSTRNVKIFDFGLSQRTKASVEFTGSPLYMAPEIHLRTPYDPFLADVWSIGICFFEILTGDTPFCDCVDRDDLLDQLLFGEPIYEVPEYFSTNATVLLKKMLTRDPSSRISTGGIVDELESLSLWL